MNHLLQRSAGLLPVLGIGYFNLHQYTGLRLPHALVPEPQRLTDHGEGVFRAGIVNQHKDRLGDRLERAVDGGIYRNLVYLFLFALLMFAHHYDLPY